MRLGVADDGRFRNAHVIVPCLRVHLASLQAARLYLELCREDVSKLCAEAISAAGHFLFFVIIVARGQQLAEDQLWHVASVLFVHFDGDAFAVVVDAYPAFALVDLDFD